jgi:hypothetical protein
MIKTAARILMAKGIRADIFEPRHLCVGWARNAKEEDFKDELSHAAAISTR